MPVLPAVGSMMVTPGRSVPWLSAARIMWGPMRSLTLPPGVKYTSFAYSSTRSRPSNLRMRTSGVPPSRTTAPTQTPSAWGMQKPPDMPSNPIVDPILSWIRRRCTGREDNKRRDARERAPRRWLAQMVKVRRRGRLLADLRLGVVLAVLLPVLLPQGLALLLAVVERDRKSVV